jgi:hypothetical protein
MIEHMSIRILKEYRRLLYADGLKGCLRFLLTYYSQGFSMDDKIQKPIKRIHVRL